MSRQMAAQYNQRQTVELMERFVKRLEATLGERAPGSTLGDFIATVEDPRERAEFVVAATVADDLEKKGRKLRHIRLVIHYRAVPGEKNGLVRIEYDPVAISIDVRAGNLAEGRGTLGCIRRANDGREEVHDG